MTLKSLLISVRSSMTNLQNVIKPGQKIDSLYEENSELKSKLALCENAVDDLEQYGRRNCLLFLGIKEATGEDCDEEVINLCRERLHIEIMPTMIERAITQNRSKEKINEFRSKNETNYSKIRLL